MIEQKQTIYFDNFLTTTLGEELDEYVKDYRLLQIYDRLQIYFGFFQNNFIFASRSAINIPYKEKTILGEELDDFLREFVSSVHTEDQVFK